MTSMRTSANTPSQSGSFLLPFGLAVLALAAYVPVAVSASADGGAQAAPSAQEPVEQAGKEKVGEVGDAGTMKPAGRIAPPQEPGVDEGEGGGSTSAAVRKFRQANERLRDTTLNLLNSEGRKRGHTIEPRNLLITSMADNLIVAGAPVAGIREKLMRSREGAPQGEKKDVVIGILLVAGGGGGVVEAASQKKDPRAVGGVPTGVFRVMGRLQGNERMVAIVGDDNKVITHVKIDPKWGSARNEFWRPVFMSVLESWMPVIRD